MNSPEKKLERVEPRPLELIEQLLDEHRFEEAEPLLLRQLEKKENLAAVYNALAIVAIEAYHNYQDAENCYRQALYYSPDSATLYFNLGILYDQFLTQPDQAMECYQKAIELNEEYVDAYLNLSELCIDLNMEMELAFDCCRCVEQLEPHNARNLNNYGCLYIKYKEDVPMAIPYFERAVLYAQNKATSLANLADAYVRTDQFEAARDAYEQSLAIEGDHHLVCHNYAYILRHHFKEYQRAIEYYERAIKLDPTDLLSYQGLRSLYTQELKDPKRGVQVLESALPYTQDLERLLLEIANIYDFEIEDYETSMMYYERVIEINPNNLLALNALAYLSVEILKDYQSAIRHI